MNESQSDDLQNVQGQHADESDGEKTRVKRRRPIRRMFVGGVIGASLGVIVLLVLVLSVFPLLTGYLCRRYLPLADAGGLLLVLPAGWVLGEWVRGRLDVAPETARDLVPATETSPVRPH